MPMHTYIKTLGDIKDHRHSCKDGQTYAKRLAYTGDIDTHTCTQMHKGIGAHQMTPRHSHMCMYSQKHTSIYVNTCT